MSTPSTYRSAALAVMGAVCLLGTGCTDRAPESSPNVLLVTLDTVRADYIGTYGFEAEYIARHAPLNETVKIDPEQAKRLRAIGYLDPESGR